MLILIGLIFHWRHKRKQLETLPKNQRAQQADEFLTRYKVNVADASPEARVELVKSEMWAKQVRFIIVLVAVVLVLGFAVMANIFGDKPGPTKPIQPQEEFSFIDGNTAEDPSLPHDLFGQPNDDVGQPRQWMRVMEAGGASKLKATVDQTARRWQLTNEFTDLHRDVVLHAYVKTPEKVIISAFRVIPADGGARFIPLLRSPEGEQGLYRFNVPEIQPHDRLLVVVFLRQSSYDSIVGSKKILLRSQAVRSQSS